MRASVPRATFIALRARREAYRISADILYGRTVDVRVIECPACHSTVTPAPQSVEIAVCKACGQRIPLPSHLQRKPKRELTAAEIEAVAEDERLTAYAEAEAARQERRLLWFWLIAGALGVIVMFYAVYVMSPRVPSPGAF